ncbi:hypothetical protein JW948_02760 [bacterium]|nr:hypothetical protein [bacterium]
MNRRKALGMTAAVSAALAADAFTQQASGDGEAVKLEGGWQYKELSYEKHIPEVQVSREDDMAVIHVEVSHPQTAEHHISEFRIYDENRIEIVRSGLHPVLSRPATVFYLKIPAGAHCIAVSDCNIHGIWMKKFIC